ncbi:MAG: hypothetical protein JKY94_05275 [Rhodobacteraceae bacterium]|nr:hypothetical protein [Paracoccaceae bacterium]
MKRLVLVLTILSACGADGEPEQPTMDLTLGVFGSHTYVGVGVHQGPVSLYVGF